MNILLFRDRTNKGILAAVPISKTTLDDETADPIGPVMAYLKVNGRIDSFSQVQVTGVEIPDDAWTDVS